MGEKVRVGMIGYGFSGSTFHAPVMTAIPDIQLKKIVQRRSMTAKDRYPSVEIVRDANDLYNDEELDLIVVTTPSTDHYRFIKDALMAGKHVVVEKPFTTTTAEADHLMDLAKRKGKMLSVFHNRRWDGDFLTLKKITEQQLLGRITDAEFKWERYSPQANPENWRDSDKKGSGILYDLGVHFFDQMLCLFGKPQTIRANIQTLRPETEADDYFDVTFGYSGGLSIQVKCSMLAREQGPRYVLHGTKGSFVKYGEDPQEEALKSGQTPASSNWGREPKEQWGTLNTTINDLHFIGQAETIPGAYHTYYQNVCDHITGKRDLIVTAEEASLAIYLIELAQKSNEEQRTIVLPE